MLALTAPAPIGLQPHYTHAEVQQAAPALQPLVARDRAGRQAGRAAGPLGTRTGRLDYAIHMYKLNMPFKQDSVKEKRARIDCQVLKGRSKAADDGRLSLGRNKYVDSLADEEEYEDMDEKISAYR